MPKSEFVLSRVQRDALFNKLREDPQFRELMKTDWRKAMETMKLKPDAVAQGVLSRSDVELFPGQRASWTIEIVISARFPNKEVIEMKDSVAFDVK